MMRWFRRDSARKAAQTTRSRAFTLGGIVAMTALLAVATALIALPMARTRDRQMTRAARDQANALFEALEAYRGIHYRFPDRVEELRTVGYSAPASIVVCRFTHVRDARNFDDHVELALHHRGGGTALVGRYPARGQLSEVDPAAACTPEENAR